MNLYHGLTQYADTQWIITPQKSALAHYCLQHQLNFYPYAGERFHFNLNFARFLGAFCNQHAIDLIHVHDSHMHSTLLLAKFLFRFNAKVVVSRKVAFPLKRTWLTRLKYNSKSIDKIICVSEAVRDCLSPVVADAHKLVIIYDGVDIKKFQSTEGSIKLRQQLSQSPNVKLIGIAAELSKNKDLFTFIDVAKAMQSSGLNLHFLIFGEGPLRSKLEAYVQIQELTEKVTFMGFQSNFNQLLPQLDAFMLTSLQEGAGSVLIEAMASGVPVVATRVGGIPEIVIENQTGLLANCGDAKVLSQQLSEILTNSVLRKKLIIQARAHAEKFSLETMVDNTWKIYQTLLSS